MPIVRVIRVGRVQKREFGILTMILADFVLELYRVRRRRNETGRRVDDGLLGCNFVVMSFDQAGHDRKSRAYFAYLAVDRSC